MASGGRGGAGYPAVLPGGDGPPRLESLSPGYTASVLEDQIAAEMEDLHRGEGAEKKSEKRVEGPGEKGRAEKKAKKNRRDAVKKAEPAAIKDITTSNLQDQLALRAATVAQERQKKRQIEKKKEDRDPSKELLRILTKSLGKKKKEKKTGKKKRKKKRGSGGGDPGGGPGSSSGSGGDDVELRSELQRVFFGQREQFGGDQARTPSEEEVKGEARISIAASGSARTGPARPNSEGQRPGEDCRSHQHGDQTGQLFLNSGPTTDGPGYGPPTRNAYVDSGHGPSPARTVGTLRGRSRRAFLCRSIRVL